MLNSNNIAISKKTFFSFLLCTVTGFLVTLAFLIFFSWIILKTGLPLWVGVPFASTAVCLGCISGAFVMTKRIGHNGLFSGFCVGIFFFLLYWFAAMINGQLEFSAVGTIKQVSCILSGCLGGFLGVIHCSRKK